MVAAFIYTILVSLYSTIAGNINDDKSGCVFILKENFPNKEKVN